MLRASDSFLRTPKRCAAGNKISGKISGCIFPNLPLSGRKARTPPSSYLIFSSRCQRRRIFASFCKFPIPASESSKCSGTRLSSKKGRTQWFLAAFLLSPRVPHYKKSPHADSGLLCPINSFFICSLVVFFFMSFRISVIAGLYPVPHLPAAGLLHSFQHIRLHHIHASESRPYQAELFFFHKLAKLEQPRFKNCKIIVPELYFPDAVFLIKLRHQVNHIFGRMGRQGRCRKRFSCKNALAGTPARCHQVAGGKFFDGVHRRRIIKKIGQQIKSRLGSSHPNLFSFRVEE